MTFTLTPISVLDAAAASKPIVSYNDGTNNAFAHASLDSTGALISPATSGKQDTIITAVQAIQSSVAAATPSGSNIIGRVTTDQTTHGTTDLVAADITKVAGGAIAQGAGTAATAIRVELPSDGTGKVGLNAGTAIIGVVKTDQTTHGTTDLVAADITKVAGSTIAQGHGTAAAAIRVELPSDGTGTVGLNAGSNIIGVVKTDQTTHGTTDLVAADITKVGGTAVSLGQKAMSASVPVVVASDQTPIPPKIVTASAFTRPADTTTYAVGDLVANSTTAGSVTPITIAIARGADMPGTIMRCRLAKSTTTVANAIFRVHLYNVLPTFTNGDNGAMSTPIAGYIGFMDVTVLKAFSDGAQGVGIPGQGSAINFAPVSGTSNLYAVLEAQAAYVPGNAETFTLTLEAI